MQRATLNLLSREPSKISRCPRKALSDAVRWPASNSRARWRISSRLVVNRTHRHEPLARANRRLANRRRVGRVILVPADIRLHMRRRDQSDLEAEPDQHCRAQ